LKYNVDIRKNLYGNIVLSGGTTMFPDIAERKEGDAKKEETRKHKKRWQGDAKGDANGRDARREDKETQKEKSLLVAYLSMEKQKDQNQLHHQRTKMERKNWRE